MMSVESMSEEMIASIMLTMMETFADDMKGRSIKFNADGSVSVFEISETVSTTYKSLLHYLEKVNAMIEALDAETVKH
ncbi:MAG: hypothetical protein JWO15_3541 [Sphingomonadales bacterium]|nr:hypothetical protein [Sphingomonadales bacterium]